MLMFMPMWYLAIFSCVTGSWVSDVVADTVVGGLRLAFRLSVWRDSGPYTCIYTGHWSLLSSSSSRLLTMGSAMQMVSSYKS
jgi:hypothetical protein